MRREGWVLRRHHRDGGGFVAVAGYHQSYTKLLHNISFWPTREAALAAACGNEEPMYLRVEVRQRKGAA